MKAFPTGALFNKDGLIVSGENGMDLRDYFAAKAMVPLITLCCDVDDDSYDENAVAKVAYDFADAMMEVRKPK